MKSGSNRRIANNLVALSSAAVLTVYSAGYLRTRAAAERLENAEHRDAAQRPALRAPAPDAVVPPVASEIHEPSPAPLAPAVELKAAESRKPAPLPEPVRETPIAATPVVEPATPPATTAATAAVTPVETPPVAQATTAAATATAVPPDTDPKLIEPSAPKPSPYKDGTYYGWGTSRHGSIQAAVTIEGGKIVGSSIAQCLTRYSCAVIAHLVPQVVARQSANVDYVSGATQSSDAFYDAVVEALSKAK